MASSKKNIVFLHPDLGIGGAERLVVDAAVGLQRLGHRVTIFTNHCDPAHCFDEARDGTLDVRVHGNAIIPPSIFGRFSILCAVLRQIHLLLHVTLFTSDLRNLRPDVFFVDQLSACIPLLRLAYPNAKVLFYCHFPDKLLAQRVGWVKRAYRVPFDWLESWTTGASDVIVVNSKFTRGIFGDAFPGLKYRNPHVVYPCVEVGEPKTKDPSSQQVQGKDSALWKGKKVLLSINRFERKKDVGLAIRAFAKLSKQTQDVTRLVIAGGYDLRVAENVIYHKELIALATSLNLEIATSKNIVSALSIPSSVHVLFLLSVPASLKDTLLNAASLLVYTPGFEHFGIVPLEAMLARVPVLAANAGGPTETVLDGQTGWLRSVDDDQQWADVMQTVLENKSDVDLQAMGERGRERVVELFSKKTMAERLDAEMDAMLKQDMRPTLWSGAMIMLILGLGVVVSIGLAMLLR